MSLLSGMGASFLQGDTPVQESVRPVDGSGANIAGDGGWQDVRRSR